MSPDDIPLLFRHASRRVRRKELREYFSALTGKLARGADVSCLITDDRELRRLNRKVRGHNYATDVLSFPSSAGGGEIASSLVRAAAHAAERGHAIGDEIRILMLHGVLHLRGFDHETDSGEMARAEARWRKRLGLPQGLIERTGP